MPTPWIRLQIPYSHEALQLGVSLGYRIEAASEVQVERAGGFETLEQALAGISEQVETLDVTLGEDTVLVFPLDSRHELAWAVKDEADSRGWGFARYTPEGSLPGEGALIQPEPMPEQGAGQYSFELCDRATVAARDQRLGDAFTLLREALGVTTTHLGWHSDATCGVLMYFVTLLVGSRSPENQGEALLLLRRLCHELDQQGSPPSSGAVAFLERLVSWAQGLEPDLGRRLAGWTLLATDLQSKEALDSFAVKALNLLLDEPERAENYPKMAAPVLRKAFADDFDLVPLVLALQEEVDPDRLRQVLTIAIDEAHAIEGRLIGLVTSLRDHLSREILEDILRQQLKDGPELTASLKSLDT